MGLFKILFRWDFYVSRGCLMLCEELVCHLNTPPNNPKEAYKRIIKSLGLNYKLGSPFKGGDNRCFA